MLDIPIDVVEYLQAGNRRIFAQAEIRSPSAATLNIQLSSALLQNAWSRALELIDGYWDINRRAATAEPNRFRLDGKTALHTDTDEYRWGCISDTQADANGDMIWTVEIDVLDPEPDVPLTIAFDELDNTYAVDFDVNMFSAGGNINIEVRGHDSTRWYYTGDVPSGNFALEFRCYKWSKPFSRLRIAEIGPVISKMFSAETDDSLLSFTMTDRMDHWLQRLPQGRGSFVALDADKMFNPLADEGMGQYISDGAEMIVSIGVPRNEGVIDYYQIGQYFIKRWSTKGSEVVFEFRDILQILAEDEINVSNLDATPYDSWD